MSQHRITSFFKTVKSAPKEDDSEKILSVTEKFYEDCLNHQISICKNSLCVQKKLELETQIKELETKCEEHKKRIAIAKEVIAQKVEKINISQENAKKTSTLVPCSSIDTPKEIENSNRIDQKSIAEIANASTETDVNNTLKFTKFSNHFSVEQLAHLRLIGGTKREDSSFILSAVRFMYAGRLDVLKTKTITGRSKPGAKKEQLTPAKVKVLKDIFEERVHETNDIHERAMRQKGVNKYIKDAQSNITRSISIDKAKECVGSIILDV